MLDGCVCFFDLVCDVDVVVEGNWLGVMVWFGFDYVMLVCVNLCIVLCLIIGYG